MIVSCSCCNKQLSFSEARIRYENWYHRKCAWYVARENIHSTLNIPFEFPSENVLVSLSGRIDRTNRKTNCI